MSGRGVVGKTTGRSRVGLGGSPRVPTRRLDASERRHDQLHRVAERPEARTGRRRPLSSVLVVLVVAAQPEVRLTFFLPPHRRPVE
jgi:hypothetical protein